ncbi:UNVERIFIED_CONTAM: hypothetical protein Slati_4180300 [Sesamum latifolium]|uniref:Transposase-associated domain-containing protein n=1 Tax=Sesamum latifolium TaxID=2727402 RepID=A0AAW2T9R3_9LAMI
MYEKNLPNRAGLNPEFQDGVTAFIEWAKSQQANMDGEKIRCPCRKCKNEVFKTPDEMMVRGRVLLMPILVHIIMVVAPYNYMRGLADRFQDVLHTAEQPLWNGCTTSQLAAVAELMDIKVDDQLSE